jgi:type IV pilus assembly protein PilC
LPIPRAFAEGASTWFWSAVPGLIFAAGLVGFVYWLAFRPEARKARMRLGAWARQVPWIGAQLRKIAIARTVNLLAVCLGAGLTAPESFRAAARATNDREVANACTDIAQRLARGKATVAEAVGAHPTIFDGEAYQVIASGEESGTLDASLARLGEALEDGAMAALGALFTLGRYAVLVGVVLNIGYRITIQMLHHLHDINQAIEGFN